MGIGETRNNQSSRAVLEFFLDGILPDVTDLVLRIGTPGPTQKITIQFRDQSGDIIAYLKYAEKNEARIRLYHEYKILSQLPRQLGPKVLKYDAVGDGVGLLLSPLTGKPLSVSIQPPNTVNDFLSKLITQTAVPIQSHPTIQQLIEAEDDRINKCIDALAARHWPVVIAHGDFAPWNILYKSDHSLIAFDWEYGSFQGFPHMDLIYYILQVSALVYRWRPKKSISYLINYLTQSGFTLSGQKEIQALIALAAYLSNQQGIADGLTTDNYLQQWRTEVFKSVL